MFETLNKYISDTERAMIEATPATVAAVPEVTTSVAKRNYDAAKVSRLSSNWRSNSGTANTVLNTDLRRLRDRSREMSRNAPHITQFARIMTNNIVGSKGATLQIKPKKSTQSGTARANEVEKLFKEWGKKKTCTASTKLSWTRLQRFVVSRVCIDGEVLIRKIIDSKNPFGFSLKVYNADWLDHDYRDVLPNGNRVIMGVEVDDLDKPVAYYLRRPVGDIIANQVGPLRTRVSADYMIHAYITDESEDQVHAAPWVHAMMWRLKMLGEFEMAEAVKQNAVANTVAFLKPPLDELTPRADDEQQDFSLTQVSDDGMFVKLDAGYELETFDVKPDPSAPEFKTGLLRAAAAGGGISYHLLSGDLSKVNYSSAKIGGLSERDHFENLQQWFIEDICEPIFDWFVELGRVTGKVTIDPAQFEPVFRARSWQWAEPLKEAAAAEKLLVNKLSTVREILADRGEDLDEFIIELSKEVKAFEAQGLTHPSAQAQPPAEKPKNNADAASDKKPKPPEK